MKMRVGLYIAALFAGLLGAAADTYLNVEYVMGSNGSMMDGPVITTIIIAIMSSMALVSGLVAWENKMRLVAVSCIFGLICSLAWSAPVSLSRIASAIDSGKQVTNSHNQKVDLLQQALDDTIKLRMQESKKGGCGKNCRALMTAETKIRNQLAAVGTVKDSNAGASQITHFIPWLDKKTVNAIIPVAAVGALLFLSNSLISVGFHGIMAYLSMPAPEPVKKASVKRKAKAKPRVKRKTTAPKRVPDVIDYHHPILETIAKEGEISIGALASAVGNSSPYVSTYTSELEDRGIVKREKKGRRTVVRMAS